MKDYINMELTLYLKYLIKIGTTIKYLFTSPIGLTISIPMLTLSSELNDMSSATEFLIYLFIIDFVTGVVASVVEEVRDRKTKKTFEKSIPNRIKLFFNVISSEKLKKSLVKGITYALAILLTLKVQNTFGIKHIHFETISNKEWSISMMSVMFCCAIELYSIFLENLKRVGFDLVGRILNIFTKYKSVKDKISE